MSLSRMFFRSLTTSLESNSTTVKSIKDISADLYTEGNPNRLAKKFKEASENYRFRTRNGIYEDVVRRLASKRRFELIKEILEDQKKYNDMSKEGFAIRLISLYGKARIFDHAKKVFDEMPERKCQRTVLSFNALLGACVNSKKCDLVEGFFKDLPGELSIEPDVVSYNTVLKSFCDMGALDSASSMLDVMMKKGIEPDLVTINTLLNGFYKKGQFAEGETIWGLMQKKNLSPDIRSYNAKLFGLCLGRKTKEAVELFEDMQAKEIKPDGLSFNAMIDAFVKEGNLEEAKRWYGEIEKSGCKPVKATFALFIPFLCAKGEYEFAYQLCCHMFNNRLIVDKEILQFVVYEFSKSNMIGEALDICQRARTYSCCQYDLKMSPNDEK